MDYCLIVAWVTLCGRCDAGGAEHNLVAEEAGQDSCDDAEHAIAEHHQGIRRRQAEREFDGDHRHALFEDLEALRFEHLARGCARVEMQMRAIEYAAFCVIEFAEQQHQAHGNVRDVRQRDDDLAGLGAQQRANLLE